jgi:hypothetical protein
LKQIYDEGKDTVTQFRRKPGIKGAYRRLIATIPDVTVFEAIVRSLIMKNPLGCSSYMSGKKNHPPIERVREMYTAKFVYEDATGKRIGTGQEMYNSVEGYTYGIAAVISNMANIAAHRGKPRHMPEADHFSVLLKCNDSDGERYFISIARDRVTVSSYSNDAIRKRAEHWADSVPEMA